MVSEKLGDHVKFPEYLYYPPTWILKASQVSTKVECNRVSPLIIRNLHEMFESDRAKTVVCILPTRL